MLVLIAGITGKLGSRLALAALERGLQVRGLGRNPDSLNPELAGKLESFVTTTSYYDTPALEKSVASVDAVICAYAPTPVLDLEGHLLLLRAAERAEIKIFVASSWNFNWSNIQYGAYELYDVHIAFQQHVARTSSIRPVYLFNGLFSDLLFTPYGPGLFSQSTEGATMRYWGDCKDNKFSWSTMDDAAAYTIEVLLNGNGVQESRGGYFSFRSGAHSIAELARIYESINGTKVKVIREGSIEDLERIVSSKRKEYGPQRFFELVPLAANLLGQTGKWELQDVLSLEHVRKPTTLEELLIGSQSQN
ncbi:hypothetical protein BKA66DRAFT_476691 [Pyrenochaeta sp. MPI-SDFR-AT-0127]|nr:hypothetical protein BKA66DRAFT_476691 [Pyrenochaeta sp. MPI-SDFR-AT-0127]